MRDVRRFGCRIAVLVLFVAAVAAAERTKHGNRKCNWWRSNRLRAWRPIPAAVLRQACCPKPCIRYIDRTCHKPCCGDCKPPIKTVLKVVNPATCCPVEVPVCLPACCDGCPVVDGHSGLLCRGVVTYDWCCGYRVVVRFDRCGDVTVVYRG